MIEQRWIDSLNDPDAEIRKRAVEEITKAGTPEAMNLLAGVYRNDPDAELRELARQGGIQLREQGVTLSGSMDTPQPASTPEPARMRQTATPENSVFHNAPKTREGSWADVSQILIIYGVVVTVVSFIIIQLLVSAFDPLLVEIETATYATLEEREVAFAVADFMRNGTFFFFIVATLFGIWSIIALVLQTYLIDYLAINSFKGQGNIFAFVRKYAIANGAFTVGTAAIVGFVIINAIDAIANANSTTVTSTEADAIFNSVCGLICFFFLAIIAVYWYFGRLISVHYNVSTFQGIGAFLVGSIATQIAGGFVSNILQAILLPFF